MTHTRFQPTFPPAAQRHVPARVLGYGGLIKDSFTLPTLLVLGGLCQALLTVIVPSRYALLPVTFVLLHAAVSKALEMASPAKYATKLGVIGGRTSAQLPASNYNPLQNKNNSPFGSTPAEKGIVVFHLGARFNHPLGPLAPGAKDFADQFKACNDDLLERAKQLGCLGSTTWRADQTATNNTILTVYYFQDLEGLKRFAHDPAHRQAWNWYNNLFMKKMGYSHIGIYHEAFCVPAGAYETIYVNMPPSLMAAGQASIRNEGVNRDEWVRTVVDASGSLWRSQHSRMGREVEAHARQGMD